MIKWVIALLVFFSIPLLGGSVRLYNDSPYKLQAVIRGADGTYLGEMVILPEHFNTWSSFYPSFGPGGSNSMPNPSRTMTPYAVYWYCLDGEEFAFCNHVASGAAVLAESCVGRRVCKLRNQEDERSIPYGPKEDDEQLHR